MGKISETIQEFYYVNYMSQRKCWINQLHPLVKMIVTISYILILTSIQKYELPRTLLMSIYPIILINTMKLSFCNLIKKIWPIVLLVSFIGVFNPMFDQIPIMRIGNFIVTGGMLSAITFILKGILTVLASILLIMSAGMEGVCYALRLLHIPNVFVTQILLTYRYITVFLKEADQIYQAYSLRSPRQQGIHFKAWGSLLGQLLLRSIDRANIIYESMLIRGYQGEFHYINKKKSSVIDNSYLFICLSLFVILRWLPVL